MNYANVVYLDSGSTYPAGEVFDRLVVIEDVTFSTFEATWKVGNTETDVTATEITGLTAGFVAPGVIKNVVVGTGKILLSRDA